MQVEIIPYRPEHQPWFEKFNRDWIEKTFWMEPLDVAILQSPDEHILKRGGAIFMALLGKELAGTVAMKSAGTRIYELTKMGVSDSCQNRGVGKQLMITALAWAGNMNAEKVILTSSTKLPVAISMYRKFGFQEIPVDGLYARGDIKMELKLV